MSKNQVSGMAGVYLAAAELSLRGYVVALTVRNAQGSDLLLTDSICSRSYAIQVKTNKTNPTFWRLGPRLPDQRSPSSVYILVNLIRNEPQFFLVPSRIVAKEARVRKASKTRKRTSYSIYRKDIEKYKDNWGMLRLAPSGPKRSVINTLFLPKHPS